MHHNTEVFIEQFNKLEAALRSRMGKKNSIPFAVLVNEASKRDAFVRRHKSLLDSFRELRNVLVHEEGNRIIATPTDAAVRGLAKFVEIYTRPVLIYDIFKGRVVIAESSDHISHVLSLMHNHGYTNIPVYDGGICIGIINGRVITKWLSEHCLKDGMLDTNLNEINAGDVLDAVERIDDVAFISRRVDVMEFLQIYDKKNSGSGVFIITENGSSKQKPLGIVTDRDIGLVYDKVNVDF